MRVLVGVAILLLAICFIPQCIGLEQSLESPDRRRASSVSQHTEHIDADSQRYRSRRETDEDEDDDDDEKDDSGLKMVGDRPAIAKFIFSQCKNGENDTILVKTLDVIPNPIEIPGNVTFHVTADFMNEVTSPLSVQLEMEKQLPILFGESSWFKIPCFKNGFGSCLHDDICDVRIFKESGCVDSKGEHYPCSCPFEKGTYTFMPTTYKIPPLPSSLPSYLLEGDFLVRAILLRDGERIGCYESTVQMGV